MDIDLPEMPCSCVSIDAMDIMGNHEINVHGSLNKIKLDSQGNVMGEAESAIVRVEDHGDHTHAKASMDVEQAKKAFKRHEGCRI
eukprot:CAMPEP_0201283312 /NCGR_PEP_ID=MMETSP1317-20130820/8203_1 /ASSEMBLY_ACC=CAM_ASM_000770 /TAXON_ID=187299 /ORGANISM="Undescribed Undescribed, Strain Undescribed" /LENGTH=84 /DNA_ID=CAMNT_0047599101 /DNA_START=228 /DNA_END=482 /DNA_ORIENTATION=+